MPSVYVIAGTQDKHKDKYYADKGHWTKDISKALTYPSKAIAEIWKDKSEKIVKVTTGRKVSVQVDRTLYQS